MKLNLFDISFNEFLAWTCFSMKFNELLFFRAAGPLDIVGLPSYEKLNEEERDVCSEARVFPEVFLEIKKTFVEECSKSNGLRLADARPLVKIDVNKTRKLYDFLLKKELIFPPN